MKVIVVGAGVVGLATAWALKRRGHEPVVIDQGAIPNPISSSYDEHRLIRYAYGDELGYTRMVADAFRAWGELWHDLDAIHYVKTGTIAVCSSEDDETDRSRRAHEALHIPLDLLDPKALQEALPQYRFEKAEYGLFNPDGGPLLADRIVDGLAGWLSTHGVELIERRRVVRIQPEGAVVTLEGGDAREGDRLVLAAGAWTTKLLPELRGQSAPSRQLVSYVQPAPRFRLAWEEGPCLAHYQDGVDYYHLPPVRGCRLKFSTTPWRRPGDPDDPRAPAPDEPEAAFEPVRRILHEPEHYKVVDAKVCYYGQSDTGRFIVAPLGAGLAITNCCGHMFKFGALIGQEVARTLAGERSVADLTCWAAGGA